MDDYSERPCKKRQAIEFDPMDIDVWSESGHAHVATQTSTSFCDSEAMLYGAICKGNVFVVKGLLKDTAATPHTLKVALHTRNKDIVRTVLSHIIGSDGLAMALCKRMHISAGTSPKTAKFQ